jgi:hypothetical protein
MTEQHPLTDYKQLCAELVDAIDSGIPTDRMHSSPLMLRARAALAEPEPEVPTPQAIPVSERLPGPEDCDAEGRCWWGRPESEDWAPDWILATPEAIAEYCEFLHPVAWLPAHALPQPNND